MWLRDSANPGFQSLNFGGAGISPWMQPRVDTSLLGLQPDIYQTMAAAAFQDPTKMSPTMLQFQQPQNMVGRATPLLQSQILQQMQPQFQQHQHMPMDFTQHGAYGYPQQPFGFVPDPMPPPWAFNGAYQQFPPNPAYGMQSNQWLASQQPGFQQ
jgi:hypothetical protein